MEKLIGLIGLQILITWMEQFEQRPIENGLRKIKADEYFTLVIATLQKGFSSDCFCGCGTVAAHAAGGTGGYLRVQEV